jgi:uncharacterized lipoprotein YajG
MAQLQKEMTRLITIAIIATLFLASCAELPLTLAVEGEHGTYSYSAKRGLVIEVNAAK